MREQEPWGSWTKQKHNALQAARQAGLLGDLSHLGVYRAQRDGTREHGQGNLLEQTDLVGHPRTGSGREAQRPWAGRHQQADNQISAVKERTKGEWCGQRAH